MAGRAKEDLPGGSLKYLFVYFKIRISKCNYRIIYIYINNEYIYLYTYKYINTTQLVYLQGPGLGSPWPSRSRQRSGHHTRHGHGSGGLGVLRSRNGDVARNFDAHMAWGECVFQVNVYYRGNHHN